MGHGRENEAPMPEPIAYFLTWTTYGTWLPGDDRGWVEYGHGWHPPDMARELEARARMNEDACRLDGEQRVVVECQIAETCNLRGWELHAVNCRSNHVHVVVTATQAPRVFRNQLKAWCTRRLKELEIERVRLRHQPGSRMGAETDASTLTKVVNECLREEWWAERGSQRFINDLESLEAAILYVRDAQDKPRQD